MTHGAYEDYTGSPPWPVMMRLHAGSPHHCYLCLECGGTREEPNGALPRAGCEETVEILAMPGGEQLEPWGERSLRLTQPSWDSLQTTTMLQ